MDRLIDRQIENIEKVYESIPFGGKVEFSKSALESIHQVLRELKEYKDLIEQGLMIELPCRVGDVIYEANLKRNIVSKYSITRISTSVKGHYSINMDWVLLEGVYSNTLGFNADAIGKSVFLTREEAEEKLKEMERDE